MHQEFDYIELRVPSIRFEDWEHFIAATPEYSIGAWRSSTTYRAAVATVFTSIIMREWFARPR